MTEKAEREKNSLPAFFGEKANWKGARLLLPLTKTNERVRYLKINTFLLPHIKNAANGGIMKIIQEKSSPLRLTEADGKVSL